jgi:hypothetical protein
MRTARGEIDGDADAYVRARGDLDHGDRGVDGSTWRRKGRWDVGGERRGGASIEKGRRDVGGEGGRRSGASIEKVRWDVGVDDPGGADGVRPALPSTSPGGMSTLSTMVGLNVVGALEVGLNVVGASEVGPDVIGEAEVGADVFGIGDKVGAGVRQYTLSRTPGSDRSGISSAVPREK